MRLAGKSYLEILQAGGGIFSSVRAVLETTKKSSIKSRWETPFQPSR